MNSELEPPFNVRGEYNVIRNEINDFVSNPRYTYKDVMPFLEQEKKHLKSIKDKLGKDDLFYVAISTDVVETCLKKINDSLNSEKNKIARLSIKYEPQYYSYYRELKDVSQDSWAILKELDKMAMEYQFRYEQYTPTYASIKATCDELGIDTRSAGAKLISAVDESPVTGCFGDLLGTIIKIVIVAFVFWGLSEIFKMCD